MPHPEEISENIVALSPGGPVTGYRPVDFL
jgi:hypothetical protein